MSMPPCVSQDAIAAVRPVRILLADDHLLFREGVKTLLQQVGHEVVAEAAEGRGAIRLAQQTAPDVAIVDFRMPELNGAETSREIARVSPCTRTILLTSYAEEPYITAAFQAGVAGYVLKSQGVEELLSAIEDVVAGRTYLSPHVSLTVVQTWLGGGEAGDGTLTALEREVLRHVAEGKTTRELAEILDITVNRAEAHRARIMTKLNIRDTAGLVRYAVRLGLVRP